MAYRLKPLGLNLTEYTIYETKARFYIIASDLSQTHFRVVKIDRSAAIERIEMQEDSGVYDRYDVQNLKEMLQSGNSTHGGAKSISHGCGILGFVRFTKGYYLILITKRRAVGLIDRHTIYAIEETEKIYLPYEKPGFSFAEERYKEQFSGFDFRQQCYYSYSYDITHTLQYNMSNNPKHYPSYNKRLVWNQYLMKPIRTNYKNGNISDIWSIPVIYGFFSQRSMDVYGSNIQVTLICRRSSKFAGTRYLKRGTNEKGEVANDVETEQILCEPNYGHYSNGKYTSFVQHRGSIPLYWTQDNTGGVPKPPIDVLRNDPFYISTIHHFQDLFARYGSPIYVLSLIRSKEKRPRETILRSALGKAIDWINNSITDPNHKIQYKAWDFKHETKNNGIGVIRKMNAISQDVIKQIGIFHSGKQAFCNVIRDNMRGKETFTGGKNYDENHVPGTEQRGIIRTNCIDSLDRTNAVQYCIGQCALGLQLYALGMTKSPNHTYDSSLSSLLMEMYEKSGNFLALQYGGSGLAHTLNTFNTKNVFDTFNSLKRYYNNVFSDAYKQASMNLVLGKYKAYESNISLFDLPTDYWLHITPPTKQLICNDDWWSQHIEEFGKSKPYEVKKIQPEEFDAFYELNQISSFDEILEHEYNTPVIISELQRPSEERDESEKGGLKVSQWFKFSKTTSKHKQPVIQQQLSSEEEPMGQFLVLHIDPEMQKFQKYLDLEEANTFERSVTRKYRDYINTTSRKKPKLKQNFGDLEICEKYIENSIIDISSDIDYSDVESYVSHIQKTPSF
eukprot:TRINITY_DN12202_c0_g1_i1.p1 TRINITY_DN12202_c0_g1~~TRINITY_DN12202_c0_g1_i1.p1  ORF type:complete len:789 (+),score=137.40 TRINITY_DN12202_c0_g1_i1:3-2369(+)